MLLVARCPTSGKLSRSVAGLRVGGFAAAKIYRPDGQARAREKARQDTRPATVRRDATGAEKVERV